MGTGTNIIKFSSTCSDKNHLIRFQDIYFISEQS
jgi:hypothetical protein